MDMIPRPDPATSPPPIDDYLATIVEIHLPDRTIVITPVAEAASDPPGDHLGGEVVHLITAANPFSLPYTDEQNLARNREAARELDRLGVRHVPSLGRDRARTWTEPGFALLDADEDEVMRLAGAWSQHGIYRWDARGWWLVLTDGSSPTRYPVEITSTPEPGRS